MTSPWLFLLALAGATLILSAAGYLRFGDLSDRRRRRLQRSMLEASGRPALISTADGRALWANNRLREASGLERGPDGFLVACEEGETGELLGKIGKGIMPYDGYTRREENEKKKQEEIKNIIVDEEEV